MQRALFEQLRDFMQRAENVQEAYSLAGGADYLADIVNDVPMPHDGVAHVRSFLVLDRLKTTRKIPLKLGGH